MTENEPTLAGVKREECAAWRKCVRNHSGQSSRGREVSAKIDAVRMRHPSPRQEKGIRFPSGGRPFQFDWSDRRVQKLPPHGSKKGQPLPAESAVLRLFGGQIIAIARVCWTQAHAGRRLEVAVAASAKRTSPYGTNLTAASHNCCGAMNSSTLATEQSEPAIAGASDTFDASPPGAGSRYITAISRR